MTTNYAISTLDPTSITSVHHTNPDYKDIPSFIEISAEWIKHFASYNQLAYLQSISFEHQMQKHRFWNKVYDMYVKSKKDHENRMVVRNVILQ